MKKHQKIRAVQRKVQATTIILIVFTLLFLGMLARKSPSSKSSQQDELLDDPRIGTQSKYDELTKQITTTNVCPGITPVHIFREVNGEKLLHATGGRFAGDGMILTCGHAFWDIPSEYKVPWKFYYQILQPYEKKFHPINRVQTIDAIETNTVSASRDVMVCIPGIAELVHPLRAPNEASTNSQIRFDYYKKYAEKLPIRSTVTGESFNVIGETKMTGGPVYFVLDCSTFQSQSGTIYVSTNNKTLYILSRSMLLNPELRKVFELSESSKSITLCASVLLN